MIPLRHKIITIHYETQPNHNYILFKPYLPNYIRAKRNLEWQNYHTRYGVATCVQLQR